MSGYGGGGQQTPEQSAAHAAAWAAYYQSQGAQAGSAYNTAPAPSAGYAQPPLPAGPPPPTQVSGPGAQGSNPYANYGYGAGAQHTPRPPHAGQAGHGSAPSHGQGQGQPHGYVPPQPYAGAGGPSAYAYNQAPGASGYGADQTAYGGQAGPQQAYPNPQAGYGGYQPPSGGQQGGPGQYGSYGPGPGQQQAGYRPPAAHQPYQPQPQPYAGSAGSPYSNSGTPGPPGPAGPRPARPFGGNPPQNGFTRAPSNPPGPHGGPGPQGRPPMNSGPFPPAKRPRFDGPGGPGVGVGAGMNAPMHTNQMPNLPRPPVSSVPPRPPMQMNGGPGPGVMRPPIRPVTPQAGPSIPPARPPIRLGLGGPPPNLPFAPRAPAGTGAAISMRGVPAGPAARGGRGGMPNAPRGPAGRGGLRLNDRRGMGVGGPGSAAGSAGAGAGAAVRGDRDRDKEREERRRKDREQRELESKDGGRRERERDQDKDRGSERDRDGPRKDKMTMTDWRIVGIEIRGLGRKAGAGAGAAAGQGRWVWGVTGEDAGWKTAEAAAEAQALGHAQTQGGEQLSRTEAAEDGTEVKQEEGADETPAGVEGDGALVPTVAADSEVKQEPADVPIPHEGEAAEGEPAAASASAAEAEEARRRGEKRKAKSPDGEDESEGTVSKRRPAASPSSPAPEAVPESAGPASDAAAPGKTEPAESAVAAGASAKADQDPSTSPSKPPAAATGPSSIYDSNSNRLRIYFESAPELDRIPKSLRRSAAAGAAGAGAGRASANANGKRGRESSSVAPTVGGGAGQVEEAEVEVLEEERDTQGPETEAAHGGKEGEQQQGAEPATAGEGEEVRPAAEEVDVGASKEAVAGAAEHEEEGHAVGRNLGQTEEALSVGAEAPVPEVLEVGVESTEAASLPTTAAEDAADPAVEEPTSVAGAVATEMPVAVEQEHEEAGVGDVSMRTDGGAETSAKTGEESADPVPDAVAATEAEAENMLSEVAALSAKAEENEDPEAAAAARAAELAATLAQSASNMASAYGNRRPARETSTFSAADSAYTHLEEHDHEEEGGAEAEQSGWPSKNRLTILYEGSGRRLCFDAEVVERVNIHRAEGRIEVMLKPAAGPEAGHADGPDAKKEEDEEQEGQDQGVEDDAEPEPEPEVKLEAGGEEGAEGGEKEVEKPVPQLPKGVLVEVYDTTDQRFVSLTHAQLAGEAWIGDATVPPLHLAYPGTGASSASITAATDPHHADEAEHDTEHDDDAPDALAGPVVTVYLNKKRPLSESKWCRTDRADEWLTDQFGPDLSARAGSWKGKLYVLDPDAGPTIQSILDSWASTSTSGIAGSRRQFVASLLTNPNDLLEILLRLTRGERNTPVPLVSGAPSASAAGGSGPGVLAQSIRQDSPYASHQTHVSLAILAMYRLTTDYAAKAGVSEEGVLDKVGDIIRSLPGKMIEKSLEGMWKEWNAEEGKKKVKGGKGR